MYRTAERFELKGAEDRKAKEPDAELHVMDATTGLHNSVPPAREHQELLELCPTRITMAETWSMIPSGNFITETELS